MEREEEGLTLTVQARRSELCTARSVDLRHEFSSHEHLYYLL